MSRYSGGIWNLQQGRDPDVAARQAFRLMREQELDFLLMCEIDHHVGALIEQSKGTPWKFVGYRKDPDDKAPSDIPARDSGILMRREYPSRKRLHDLGGIEWERGQGRPGLHTPRKMVSDVIDSRFRVGAVHLPPTPRLTAFPRRDKAHRVAVQRLALIGARWEVPFLLGGDWNMRASAIGKDTPMWLAAELDAVIASKGGIDYVMAHDVAIRRLRKLDFGTADHDPRVFDVLVA